jgi:hypothetical protein
MLSHDLQDYVPFATKSIITYDNDKKDIVSIYLKDNIWSMITETHGESDRISNHHPLFNNLVDVGVYDDDLSIVITEWDEPDRYKCEANAIFINVKNIPKENWTLTDSGLVLLEDNILYYYSPDELNEELYNTVELDTIKTNYDTCIHIYMFKDVPQPINSITVTNYLIAIQSEDKHYYLPLELSDFKVPKFTEIRLDDAKKSEIMVNKSHVIRQRKMFDEEPTDFNISPTANKFDRFLIICELTKGRTNFDIRYSSKSEITALGDGAKREFMENALDIFALKYLIREKIYPRFNFDKMSTFTAEDHFNLGIMFHCAISMNKNPISFRLPLILLESIRKRKITVAEFEFFAKIQDKEAFDRIVTYKSDPEGFDALGTDYTTYEDAVRALCGYPIVLETKPESATEKEAIIKMCDDIATGFKFYMETPNINIMNIPTLDFYLSGDFLVDREQLIKAIKISSSDQAKISTYYETMKNIIKSLPEEKVVILLKNWSAYSVFEKFRHYTINIIENKPEPPRDPNDKSPAYHPPDVHFQTCSFSILINKNLIDNEETYDHMLELLTTPMNSMVDN